MLAALHGKQVKVEERCWKSSRSAPAEVFARCRAKGEGKKAFRGRIQGWQEWWRCSSTRRRYGRDRERGREKQNEGGEAWAGLFIVCRNISQKGWQQSATLAPLCGPSCEVPRSRALCLSGSCRYRCHVFNSWSFLRAACSRKQKKTRAAEEVPKLHASEKKQERSPRRARKRKVTYTATRARFFSLKKTLNLLRTSARYVYIFRALLSLRGL